MDTKPQRDELRAFYAEVEAQAGIRSPADPGTDTTPARIVSNLRRSGNAVLLRQ